MFEDLDLSFYKTMKLWVMRARNFLFKTVFVAKSVSFFGAKGLPIVRKHFLGVHLSANGANKQMMTV